MNSVFPLKYIVWQDAFGAGPSWNSIESLKDGVEPLFITSVGFEVYRDEKTVVLVPHIHSQDEHKHAEPQGCGDMTIPLSAIISDLFLTNPPRPCLMRAAHLMTQPDSGPCRIHGPHPGVPTLGGVSYCAIGENQ